MSKNKRMAIDNILANNPQVDMKLIEESDDLRRSSFGGLKTPEYTLLPALGTEKQRLDNRANIYHLG